MAVGGVRWWETFVAYFQPAYIRGAASQSNLTEIELWQIDREDNGT